MRWRQVYDPETDTSQFVPIDEAAQKLDADKGISIIRDNFDAFRSVVDGTVISNHRELEEHNRRNNVVNSCEFSPEFLARKKAEREQVLSTGRTKGETRAIKVQMYENIIRQERGLPLQE